MAFGISMGYVFAMMWHMDVVRVCEPILWVRILELLMCLAFVAFGGHCMWHFGRQCLAHDRARLAAHRKGIMVAGEHAGTAARRFDEGSSPAKGNSNNDGGE